MFDDPVELPAYLNKRQPIDDERWRAIEDRFEDLSDVVRLTRLETLEEAVGKRDDGGNWRDTAPTAFDWDAGVEVCHELLVPFVDAIPLQDLKARYDVARNLLPRSGRHQEA